MTFASTHSLLLLAAAMPVQNGQLMYYCHLRNADPLHCPVAADGMFQLMRFGVKGQPFPDLSPGTEENW